MEGAAVTMDLQKYCSTTELLIAHTLRAGTQRDQPDPCHYQMELGSGEAAS